MGMSLNFSVYSRYGGAGQALWLTFVLLWLVTLTVLVVSYLVKRSRFGLGLIAIREDEDTAMVMGVKAPRDQDLGLFDLGLFPRPHRHHLFL